MAERVQVSSASELNALVAERVMGATWESSGDALIVGSQALVLDGRIAIYRNVHGKLLLDQCLPDFWGSIADAWSVVEHERPAYISMLLQQGPDGPVWFECALGYAFNEYTARARTVAAAFCLAALAAHGIDVELTGELS